MSPSGRGHRGTENDVVELAPVSAPDVPAVARFMHDHLNPRVPQQRWADAMRVPWAVDAPNHGYHLRQGGEVVGAYLAYYSSRQVAGRTENFCNLGAWCVLEGHRHQGMRLLTRLLGQRGYHFTDFSPSGNVVPLNRRLKFVDLDTTTALVPNWPVSRPVRGVDVTEDADVLADTLSGEDLRVFQDHRQAAAAGHVLISTPREHCYVIYRRDTRKGLRAFGSILHVGNHELFRAAAPRLGRHLLVRHGIPATLVELRVSRGMPRGGIRLGVSRPKMFRSSSLAPEQVDYLYSELTCLAW